MKPHVAVSPLLTLVTLSSAMLPSSILLSQLSLSVSPRSLHHRPTHSTAHSECVTDTKEEYTRLYDSHKRREWILSTQSSAMNSRGGCCAAPFLTSRRAFCTVPTRTVSEHESATLSDDAKCGVSPQAVAVCRGMLLTRRVFSRDFGESVQSTSNRLWWHIRHNERQSMMPPRLISN